MPLKVAESLGAPEMRETTMPLVLGDGTLCYPRGIIDDIPVLFKGHTLRTTFIVINSANISMDKVIFGRHFLSATRAEIFVAKERVDFYLGAKKEKYQVWMRKKPKLSKKRDDICLSDCKFLQEVVEHESPPSPKPIETSRRKKRIRKRKVKTPPEKKVFGSVMEWRVKESHDLGGARLRHHYEERLWQIALEVIKHEDILNGNEKNQTLDTGIEYPLKPMNVDDVDLSTHMPGTELETPVGNGKANDNTSDGEEESSSDHELDPGDIPSTTPGNAPPS